MLNMLHTGPTQSDVLACADAYSSETITVWNTVSPQVSGTHS